MYTDDGQNNRYDQKKKIESTTKLACLVFYFFGACLWKIENLAKEISTQLTEKYNLLTIFIA